MPVAFLMGFNSAVRGKLSAFTETHYYLTSNDPDSEPVQTAAKVLAGTRVNLLGTGMYLNEARLSGTEIKRDSVQLVVGSDNDPDSIPATPGAAILTAYGQADQTNACIRVEMGENSKRKKVLSMAGVPDKLINTVFKTIDIAAVPQWFNLYTSWRTIIAPSIGGAWGFRARELQTAAGFQPKVIQDFAQENIAPNRVGIKMLTADGPWLVGNKIQIRGTVLLNKAYRSPVGTWTIGSILVDVPNGTTTYFLRNSEGINIMNIKECGTAEKVGYTYYSYKFANILGYGTRKRGVGSNPSVGRSRNKVAKV